MRLAVLCVLAAAVACGPVDEAGAPSILAPDGGPVTQGADGGGITDAGTTFDAGAGGGGIGGGGIGGGGIGGGGTGGAPDAGPGAPGGGQQPDAGTVAVNDCDGILPTQAGRGHAETVPHGAGQQCWYFTGDKAGNVAAEAHSGDASGTSWSGTWHVWSATGAHRGSFPSGGDVYGQTEGFESTSNRALVMWTPEGQAARSTPLGGNPNCSAQAYNALNGGTLVLDACGAVTASRFDAQGNLVASQRVADSGSAIGIVDAQDRALIIANGTARWYDGNLAAVSAPFAAPAGTGGAMLRALVGGGAALQIGGVWAGVSPSGAARFDPAPSWLTAHNHFDLQIIRGGRAYACIPKSGAPARDTLDLVSVSGASCGSLRFPITGLSMGPDGTVIGSSGDGGCTATWWSALLR